MIEATDSEFGYWLSGLIDGEGHFGARAYVRKGVYRVDVIFSLGIRADDEPLMRQICDRMGVGTIHTTKYGKRLCPICNWHVARLDELIGVLIPFLDQYPLRTRYRKYFELWREVVLLVRDQRDQRWKESRRVGSGRVGGSCLTWPDTERWKKVSDLVAVLKADRRKYKGPMVEGKEAA